MIILGVETSCDETSMAIIQDGNLIALYTSSSANIQSNYGGVVPEVASRYHLKNIHNVFNETLKQANVKPEQITHIAYTNCPGLPGCLHVGIVFAKTLAMIINAQLIPVNHLYGHIFSPYIESNKEPQFPMLSLVASGGHTTLYYVKDYENILILNETVDDAIGEVYDKVARAVDWKYPGGPIIDNNYDPKKNNIKFMQPMPANAPFSYSGLKTAIINYVHNKKQKKEEFDPIAITSSFQWFVINDVIKKIKYITQKTTNIKCLSIGGGVSANKLLRNEINKLDFEQIDIPLLKYTGDQAAMIAYYAYKLIQIKINK